MYANVPQKNVSFGERFIGQDATHSSEAVSKARQQSLAPPPVQAPRPILEQSEWQSVGIC